MKLHFGQLSTCRKILQKVNRNQVSHSGASTSFKVSYRFCSLKRHIVNSFSELISCQYSPQRRVDEAPFEYHSSRWMKLGTRGVSGTYWAAKIKRELHAQLSTGRGEGGSLKRPIMRRFMHHDQSSIKCNDVDRVEKSFIRLLLCFSCSTIITRAARSRVSFSPDWLRPRDKPAIYWTVGPSWRIERFLARPPAAMLGFTSGYKLQLFAVCSFSLWIQVGRCCDAIALYAFGNLLGYHPRFIPTFKGPIQVHIIVSWFVITQRYIIKS